MIILLLLLVSDWQSFDLSKDHHSLEKMQVCTISMAIGNVELMQEFFLNTLTLEQQE